ncbi:copper chaperone PCu(A)C [Thalassotalea agarivorans]|uniref:Copper(I)-binding protein n=1 Tax=Thalassotalea agarivorans TaxID=349064 RepID=A0A1I0H5C4_THASX|nr:copper chaperone PCu(A)C [Thalassotalea agarivorans]SET78932.1 hypothetical protein SAMN05660429_02698 [Thalassotalea agarivorans]
MKKILFTLITVTTTLFSGFLMADESEDQGQVSVKNPYVRESIPGTQITSAYMQITNTTDKDYQLVGATANISPRIEIHEHYQENDVMKMRQVLALPLPANGEITMKQGGFHLMIFDIVKPVKQGQKILLTLHFTDHDDITIEVPVQGIKKQHKSGHHHH